jgi:hypothetical protein
MRYRYWMHWYVDATAALTTGRPLFAQHIETALAEARSLWSDGLYAAARGYVVVDTDDGTVICRRERAETALRPPGAQDRVGRRAG